MSEQKLVAVQKSFLTILLRIQVKINRILSSDKGTNGTEVEVYTKRHVLLGCDRYTKGVGVKYMRAASKREAQSWTREGRGSETSRTIP